MYLRQLIIISMLLCSGLVIASDAEHLACTDVKEEYKKDECISLSVRQEIFTEYRLYREAIRHPLYPRYDNSMMFYLSKSSVVNQVNTESSRGDIRLPLYPRYDVSVTFYLSKNGIVNQVDTESSSGDIRLDDIIKQAVSNISTASERDYLFPETRYRVVCGINRVSCEVDRIKQSVIANNL